MNERILNLLLLCLQAKEKGYDVFFRYSPQCNVISIDAHVPCWKPSLKDNKGEFIPGTDNCVWGTFISIDREFGKILEAETYLKGLIET